MIDVQVLAGALVNAFPPLDERDQRLALTLLRTLADGAPVSRKQLAAAANTDESAIAVALARWPGVLYDDEQRVVGFNGLSVREMSHRFVVGGRDLWTWCAWDTLFLPELIGKEAQISSTCPVTAEAITLRVGADGVREVYPPEAVVSFLVPDKPFDSNIVQSFCHFVHFFASRPAGEQWTAEREGTFLVSVDDAYQLGRRTNRAQYADALRR